MGEGKSRLCSRGSSSRVLHDFLRECAPIIGTSVPEIDLLETSELDGDFAPSESRREISMKPATISADSVESMAGISAADLSAPADQQLTDLLGENESRQQIDMSALSNQIETSAATAEVNIPEDLLDFD